jgi:hypothetical protein
MDEQKNTENKSSREQVVRADMPAETNKRAATHQKSVAIRHAFFVFRQVNP